LSKFVRTGDLYSGDAQYKPRPGQRPALVNFLVFFSHPAKCRNNNLHYATSAPVCILSNSPFVYQHSIRRHTIAATDSVVKQVTHDKNNVPRILIKFGKRDSH